MRLEDYHFRAEEVEELKKYREHQKDGRLKVRFIALLMVASQIAISEIVLVLGVSHRSLQLWFDHYLKQGINSLNSFQYKPKEEYLKEEELKATLKWLRETQPSDIQAVVDYIEDHFGVIYSQDAVRKLLKRHGMPWMRPKLVPSDPPALETQVEVILRYQQIRLFEDSGVVVLFGDAVHLVHQSQAAFCWADPKHPPLLPSTSGRQRLNILGAYNPADHRFIHHSSEAPCDAEAVKLYFEKIVAAYPTAHSIALIVDNASYLHAKTLKGWMDEHPQLILWRLPAYAPNLNLIERLWRFLKRKLVHNTYYAHYKIFRARVFRMLNHLQDYTDEFVSLMVERFELVLKNCAM